MSLSKNSISKYLIVVLLVKYVCFGNIVMSQNLQDKDSSEDPSSYELFRNHSVVLGYSILGYDHLSGSGSFDGRSFKDPVISKFIIGYESYFHPRWKLRMSVNYNPLSWGANPYPATQERQGEVKFFQMGYFALGVNFSPVMTDKYRLGLSLDLFSQKRRPFHGNFNVWNHGIGLVLMDHEYSFSEHWKVRLELVGISVGHRWGLHRYDPINSDLTHPWEISFYRSAALSVNYSF